MTVSEQQILDTICTFLQELQEGDAEITAQTDLREDLGLNSLDAVDLALKLEDEFDIELPDDELAGFETVGDVVAAVERRVGE